jgi:competence protein ComEC
MGPAQTAYAWRAAALGGLIAGLSLAAPLGLGTSPAEAGPGGPAGGPGFAVLAALAFALAAARPRSESGGHWLWLLLVVGVATLGGLQIGAARLAAVEDSRFEATPGTELALEGTVASAPRSTGPTTRFALDTREGRVAVEILARDGADASGETIAHTATVPTLGELGEGAEVQVSGVVREATAWKRPLVERLGASHVLAADRVAPTGATRTGLRGALDDVRRRAELALESGAAPPAAALLRGFVLGQDDRIADGVRDEFRRSGLAHVLAVSGQNVMLLALLAAPLLGIAGVPLRLRLVAIACLIALYVPVAGAGPSIQRAGVMGVAGVVAALASRPTARWYALGLAAAVTLCANPRATSDIGWQLSFAAVGGLLVLAPVLIRVLAPEGPGARRTLAEGVAITLAATLATAPLAAHHFGTVSLTALPANLVALPAIAPAMWLGMLAGALGQIPAAPCEPLTWLGGLCAGFIGWVAHVFGPEWAQLEIPAPGAVAAGAWTGILVGGARLVCLGIERRRGMRPAPRPPAARAITLAVVCLLAACAVGLLARGSAPQAREPQLRLSVLDVGQGDAILVEPRSDEPLLIDAGPPDAEVASQLASRGVEELGAVVITHDDLDHSGGLADVVEQLSVRGLFVARTAPSACDFVDCPPITRLSRGDRVRAGDARLEVLWPPAAAASTEEPNDAALVLELELGQFDALLTADAEAEVASYGAGRVEFLKVAHHGSADAGLGTLLGRTQPELAAISVGEGNPYGHPAPETVASLAEHGVPTLRTDELGEIVIEADRRSWTVSDPR